MQIVLTLINSLLPIYFDWIGSLLMLGTIWGWIYKQISPLIKGKLLKSERRCQSLERLIRIKYGENFSKDTVIKRHLDDREAMGIGDSMSFSDRIKIKAELHITALILERKGQLSDEERNAYAQYKSDRNQFIKLGYQLMFNKIRYQLKLIVFRIVDSITFSVFSGKIAFTLFVIGFILWNLSKLLSIYTINPT